MTTELKTSARRLGRTVVCVFAGDLHQGTAGQARQALQAALGELPEVLAVDLSGVELFASGGLPVVVVAPSAGARRVLEITGTAALFPVYANVEDAARGGDTPS
ncbi:STAS domain-containing protein [Kitasatospora sp. NPDC093679]|uniref:STAS domain-containing protein n=1 Tax=Kitasatospora sp. NPDC093679 TaxID=3154983 RepID=UPI0034384F94